MMCSGDDGVTLWRSEALELRKMVAEMGMRNLRAGLPVPCVAVKVETLEKVKAALGAYESNEHEHTPDCPGPGRECDCWLGLQRAPRAVLEEETR